MSVYTTVQQSELVHWLARYDLGELKNYSPIAAGIENTNYFVSLEGGEFVLTLYERIPPRDLPFYLELMYFLADGDLPVPRPQRDREKHLFSNLNGKPAGLIERVDGEQNLSPDEAHCAALGETLAKIHLASPKFSLSLENARGATWREEAAKAVLPFLNDEQKKLLNDELRVQRDEPDSALPRGAIHADLFRDNVLFSRNDSNRIAGIIDFGFAATDAFVYDLAIAANDWCVDFETGAFIESKLQSLMSAYRAARELDENEERAWNKMLRCAALRFWLSRLYDLHCPRPGALVHAHDPSHFERILRQRRAGR